MRKKAIALLLVTMLSVTGCGVDPLSQDTMDKISSIGEVELSDQSLIEDLEKTYSEMTEKQKNQVKNYVDLKNARAELDELIEAEKLAEVARLEEIASTFPYSEAIYICGLLKQACKDPSSMILHGIQASLAGEGHANCYCIDYSATNSLGGRIRSTTLIEYCRDIDYIKQIDDNGSSYGMYAKEYKKYFENDYMDIQELDVDFISSYL